MSPVDPPEPNGTAHFVGVREWLLARSTDRREVREEFGRHDDELETRLMQTLHDHQVRADRVHKAQDDRLLDVAKGIDGVQSIIDQQRGARNLLLFIVGMTLVNTVGVVLAIVEAIRTLHP